MTHLVYLCGPIAGHDYAGATDWRQKAARVLSEFEITTLDPMRMKGWWKRQTEKGMITRENYDAFLAEGKLPEISKPKAIFRRDRWDVQRSDLVLANFEDTAVEADGRQIASLGSAMELAWADAAGVPVIGVYPLNNLHRHPLLLQATAWEVETLDEALAMIPELLMAKWIRR